MDDKKKPIGVLFFGSINCFLLGFLPFFMFLLTFFKVKPSHVEELVELFKKKGIIIQISYRQFQIINIIYILIAFIFFVSGLGLLLKKIWGQRLTVYFSFFWLILISFSALLNPSLIQYLFINAIYPAILVLYFTKKNIQNYFKD
ncbi:MAG: hypothetical protein NC925_01300 [Candidatus Omnitrophica bacterium]|nr:hypothetical protein [Candidatus Omnitrophota bacterium]MCM8830947.1 hypothetical protein [Candidatus Omnitrophota bacterium]